MRIWLFILGLMLAVQATAQQVHKVGRGETLESIAMKYRVNIEALKAANPRMKNVYVGLSLNIPTASTPPASKGALSTANSTSTPAKASSYTAASTPGTSVDAASSNPVAQEYIRLAKEYINEGKYEKAIKQLDKSIEEEPTIYAYWLRGSNQYYRAKWKKAIADLSIVVENPSGISSDIHTSAQQMIKNANKKREEARAKNAQLWGSVAAAAALVTVAAVASSASGKSSEGIKASGISSTGSSSSSDTDNATNSGDYRRNYETQEKAVETWYNACSPGGDTVTSNGVHVGSSGHLKTKAAYYTTNMRKFKNAQQKLIQIRKDAEAAGVNITPSKWEAATVD